jgi:acyl carrier protein
MPRTDMLEKITSYLVTTLIRDEDISLAPDEPIFSSGLLDSFSVIQLMRFLEDTFDVRIEVSDVTLAEFDTVTRIGELVTRLGTRKAAS